MYNKIMVLLQDWVNLSNDSSSIILLRYSFVDVVVKQKPLLIIIITIFQNWPVGTVYSSCLTCALFDVINSHCVVLENIPIKGEGVSKAKIFKRKYKAKVEFQGGLGWGANKRAFHGRDNDIFWNKVLLQSC